MNTNTLQKINIRPDVGMLGLLKNLNYKAWYALAEFIDNALDSYLKNKERLIEIEGKGYKLKVTIELNNRDNKITIKDNAAGIDTTNYVRAFKAAGTPSDNTGLSEFGIGMKQAAFWFCPLWKVTTSALGEDVERTVDFNLDQIIKENIQELSILEMPSKIGSHYTIVELQDIHNKIPEKNGIGTVKKHLASIYREFIRKEELELWWGDEALTYKEVDILNAVPAYENTSTTEKIEWKKNIDFSIGENFYIRGFVAIREIGSPKEAGLALFRRGRIIEGSLDDTFRPDMIFGSKQGARHQRLFGELHLDGFGVSHTKDGFQWDDNMDMFLGLLRDEIKAEPSLWKQAEKYQARKDKEKKHSKEVLKEHNQKESNNVPKEIAPNIQEKGNSNYTSEQVPPKATFIPNSTIREFEIFDNGKTWRINVELKNEEIPTDWIILKSDNLTYDKKNNQHHLFIQMTTNHPFMNKLVKGNEQTIDALLKVVVSLCISETVLISSGSNYATRFRDNLNKFLKLNL